MNVGGGVEAIIEETEELLCLLEKERPGQPQFPGVLCLCDDCDEALQLIDVNDQGA